ncbi:hypothetical protein MXB_1519 [Myxobolus squamalis]|nr:hypothetical protein MXB_1519 [Myxobolus squamalis]
MGPSLCAMSSELQWDLFTDQFNTLVRMVHDFKSLEINLNDYIKQKNLGLFEKKDFKIETDPNTVLCQIIGTLNKQVLRALLHEKYLHNLSYKLLNCMSSALANIQIIIKHPELDTSSLEKYYSALKWKANI